MRKVLIDTDCGVDDAVALLIALSWQTKTTGIDILGITCVGGNVLVENVVNNVLSCVREANVTTVPIYSGSGTAILEEHASASFWHGCDGLGDVLSQEERQRDQDFNGQNNIVKTKKYGNAAVEFLVNTIMEEPNESIELITLGPLSNIALALKLEPRIGKRLKRVVVMGGSVHARGNITSTAEFNVFADPEAAHICFTELQNVTMVDWEATVNHPAEEGFWRDTFTDSFIGRLCEPILKKSVEKFGNYPLPDALAMTVFLQPESILESEKRGIEVELKQGICRGMTLVHWHDEKPELPKIEIVKKIDMEVFKTCLKRSLGF